VSAGEQHIPAILAGSATLKLIFYFLIEQFFVNNTKTLF